MSISDHLPARYSGQKGALFGLAVKTSILTILTLGIYRFWAKTRVRKYVWSSVRLGDDSIEYTGTGFEKFLGFLLAVVVLAVYLGLVQLILFYFGMHFVIEPTSEAEILMQFGVIYISLFALMPLIYFARYRARRYLMARTRYRGIRFGMDKAAWGYVWRAIVHSVVTALSLGLLLPRQTFWLEKYMTDHSYFGNQNFVQGGKWTGLYGAMKHMFIGAAMVVASLILIFASVRFAGSDDGPGAMTFVAILLSTVGYGWGLVGYLYYRVHSFRYLTAHKTVSGTVGFVAAPRTGRIIKIYFLGFLIVGFIAGSALGIVGGAAASVATSASHGGGFPIAAAIVVGVLYIGVLAVAGALTLVFITQPVIAHYVETLSVRNPKGLDDVAQRAHDPGADAEGFADALDLGGAI